MNCLYCDNVTRVTNSRLQKHSNAIWRRRKCVKCHNVISTIEWPDLRQALRVELPNGELTTFEREVLFISIYGSLKHRKQPIQDAIELTNTVIFNLVKSRKAVFLRAEIVKATLTVLKRFDKAASIQYDAFHKAKF